MSKSEKLPKRVLNPGLLRSISPNRESPRQLDYKETRKKIALISKTLYKTDIDQHPILSLERAVLRGYGNEDSERKAIQKTSKTDYSKLELYLKTEHKTKTEGTQILKLPKLRFGEHKTYNNEDDSFVVNHFVNENSNSDKQKELYDVSRKFKLGERMRKKRGHSHTFSSLNKKKDKIMYHMESGVLICTQENDIIDSYEADKEKYKMKHHYVYQTFRDIELKLDSIIERKNTYKRIKQTDELLSRLYKSPQNVKTELAKKLTEKYSELFKVNK